MTTEDTLMILLGGLGNLPEEHIQVILDTFSWEAADYVFDTMGEDLHSMMEFNHMKPAGHA
jgi:hypothetical protein